MPLQGCEAGCQLDDFLDRGRAAEMLHEVEAETAETLAVQLLQCRVRDRYGRERDAAVSPAARRNRIGDDTVVESMAGRLHDDAALDAQHRMQREQTFLRRVRRRERPIGGELKPCRGSEDVTVRVACAGRQ